MATSQLPNLVILCQSQLGSHVDTYFYCKFLKNKYSITYICWDYSLPKQTINGVKTIYISRRGNIIIRNIRYIYASVRWLKHYPTNICFIKYFRGCSILKLYFPHIKFVFDIRTGSVSQNRLFRKLYDAFMILESRFFRHLTVISGSLANKLKLSPKATIIPLGSIALSNVPKTFESINLLYVGTLSNRDIDKTLIAFSKFYHSPARETLITYTIIGDGPNNEVDQLKKIVETESLTGVVNIEGRIPFNQLTPYFDSHNIGVSFVPLTDYFDAQPVTKTFDYLLSGMPVIATQTSENKRVVNNTNGILIEDTIDDFHKSLGTIINNRNNYDSKAIMSTSSQYTWENIVSDLSNYLESISEPT